MTHVMDESIIRNRQYVTLSYYVQSLPNSRRTVTNRSCTYSDSVCLDVVPYTSSLCPLIWNVICYFFYWSSKTLSYSLSFSVFLLHDCLLDVLVLMTRMFLNLEDILYAFNISTRFLSTVASIQNTLYLCISYHDWFFCRFTACLRYLYHRRLSDHG